MPKYKLAIVCTHPIQYYAPVFRELSLSEHLDVRVFYTWSQAATQQQYDHGFGSAIRWDIPLLEGYDSCFVENVAERPGLERFDGLDTPHLVPQIEAWKADAVLVYTWNSKSHLQAMRRLKGRIPVFFRGDSTLLDARPWWRAVLRRIALAFVYRHVDVAIAVGSNNRDYFRWCGIRAERIAVAPHSVDVRRFAADESGHSDRAARWRRDLGVEPGALVFLFAGKLQKKKDPLLLLQAFLALEGDSQLVFVGNGELESALKAAATGHRNVHFLPFQNQSTMPAVYRLGDVFVLPSQGPEETWGLALNEAMASGRAVISSSKVGGARDLIQAGVNGWEFEARNRLALTDVLRHAVQLGAATLRGMGRAAQAGAAEWSTEATARRIAAIVSSHLASDGA